MRSYPLALVVWTLGCGEPAPIGLLSLNIANGAADIYRTPDARARQAALVASAQVQLVGMQEVDVTVERSGRVDTAREVAKVECALATPEYSPDGVRLCAGENGAVAFGLAFHADDPFDIAHIGIGDYDTTLNPTGTDRSHDAAYGVALASLRRSIADSYVVELPTQLSQVVDDGLYAQLGHSSPEDPARTELAARNLMLRTLPTMEPRVVLVTRIARDDAAPLSVLVTHLHAGDDRALRAHQLERVVAVANAERAGPPQRNVVVLGDFNLLPAEATAAFGAAGFRHAVGERIDQVWLDSTLVLVEGEEIPTIGVSDHLTAPRAVIR